LTISGEIIDLSSNARFSLKMKNKHNAVGLFPENTRSSLKVTFENNSPQINVKDNDLLLTGLVFPSNKASYTKIYLLPSVSP
jgi:hypothetical protein